jgi:hypothetical protein
MQRRPEQMSAVMTGFTSGISLGGLSLIVVRYMLTISALSPDGCRAFVLVLEVADKRQNAIDGRRRWETMARAWTSERDGAALNGGPYFGSLLTLKSAHVEVYLRPSSVRAESKLHQIMRMLLQ